MKKCENADSNRPLDMEALTLEQVEKANGGVRINTPGLNVVNFNAVAFNECNFNSAHLKDSHAQSKGIK